MSEADCLFCKFASGVIPVDKVHDDDLVYAINDINPRAPRHVLVIPKEHIESARSLDESRHGGLLSRMVAVANRVADDGGFKENGFRLAFNVGDDGGQTIYHLHLHLLGGRQLGPEA